MTIGTTGDTTCPVTNAWNWYNTTNPDPNGPIFRGMRYPSMLRTLRRLTKGNPDLYGLSFRVHSFRVGGAQALALAGRTYGYIMSKGR